MPGRDLWYHDEAAKVSADCKLEKMKAEDPLFILYTSGSTGKPKGVLHTTALSRLRRDDPSLCVRLSRWRYLLVHGGCGLGDGPQLYVYGPLANGATTLSSRAFPIIHELPLLEVIDKHKSTSSIRTHRDPRAHGGGGRAGERTSRKSSGYGHGRRADQSRGLGMVSPGGGDGRCRSSITWLATETGGILITPLPGRRIEAWLGDSALLGVKPALVDDKDALLMVRPRAIWSSPIPGAGMMRTVYGEP